MDKLQCLRCELIYDPEDERLGSVWSVYQQQYQLNALNAHRDQTQQYQAAQRLQQMNAYQAPVLNIPSSTRTVSLMKQLEGFEETIEESRPSIFKRLFGL